MFSNPEKNLKVFGLKESDIVADLGAGTGHYAVALGKMVPRGKVYAVELHKDFLGTIKRKVLDAGLKNVDIIWGNVEKKGGSKIGEEVLDAAIATNILFQVEDKESFINEIRRILKKGGRVFFSDWNTESIMKKAAIPKDKARAMFEKAGFRFDREVDTGEEHYGMILTKTS